MPARVCVLNNGLTVVFDGNCKSAASVILVDQDDKVMRINHLHNLRKLRDFLTDICEDFAEHKEYQKKLNFAQARCRDCSVSTVTPDSIPIPECCMSCDNRTLALEAFERYKF